jgi:methyltransferase (TIGR00027 family)
MTLIENVSDTARWVAYYRAMETKRPDAIFRDPYAERLAGDKGLAIVNELKRGRQMAWAMIVRTNAMDEMLMQLVRSNHADLVVNLAAGLDARPWRLDLPSDLRWVDVDLPEILDYKLETLKDEKARCRYEPIRLDLREAAKRQALFQQLGASARRAVVITEGLLIYLEPGDVRGLASDLATGGLHWWITDLASPGLLEMSAKMWGKSLDAGNAPFKFGPAEGTAFFEPSGWRELEYRSSMEEAKRIDRQMRGMWFWGFVARFYPKRVRERFRRFSGIVLLGRAGS